MTATELVACTPTGTASQVLGRNFRICVLPNVWRTSGVHGKSCFGPEFFRFAENPLEEESFHTGYFEVSLGYLTYATQCTSLTDLIVRLQRYLG